MIHYCLGFVFSTLAGHSHVLLIRKNKPEWMAGKFNGLGGKIEVGESSRQAMTRELKEESGLLIPAADWTHAARMSFFNIDAIVEVFAVQVEPDILLNAQSTTDEQVAIILDTVLTTSDSRFLPNLSWLLPICKYQLQQRLTAGSVTPIEIIQ